MTKRSLFEAGANGDEPSIPGLQYISNYITADQEQKLISAIDGREWLSELKRRVQHYGYKYSYKRGAKKLDAAPAFPQWAINLGKKLQRDSLMEDCPDQLIVNEYMPGQGISPHVDREELFGESIVSVSLGSPCIMEFIHTETRNKATLLLERCSAVVLQGEARHEWMHAIPGRLTDNFQGQKIERERRISLTFRNTKVQ